MHQPIRCMLFLSAIYASSGVAAEHYTLTDLGTLGFSESRATSINSAGTPVGFAETFRFFSKGEVRPFIYADGATLDLHDAIVNAMPRGCYLHNNVNPSITESGFVLGWLECGGLSRDTRRGATFSYHDGRPCELRDAARLSA